ncbi:hypothetical protein NM208_g145 [Fusarium decemcellulare]|uniref:Uncharacterized protein n=1 Tax=Fusarium decemcellulare TaxID=57161 RepID=A0ACC1T0M1_9HYPO|nr:hypothetical protein NM208_g145 [Fusarium decemcellulare]
MEHLDCVSEMPGDSSNSSTAQIRTNHQYQANRAPSNLALILDGGPSAEVNAEEAPPTKKRSRTTDDYAQRKRVPVACQFCRLRKVKCDNVRPSCGYCLRHKARCIYGELDPPQIDSASNPTEATGSDQKILARLDEIKDMLERLQVTTPASASAASSTTSPPISWNPPEILSQYPLTEAFHSQPTTERGGPRCPKPQASPLMAFRCEAILKWPALHSIVPEKDLQMDSFLLVPELDESCGGHIADSEPNGHLLPDRALTPLCRKFLTVFHPRNPILDGQKLLSFAKDVDENGLRWNSASCLVMLACAIAVTTQPWRKPPQSPRGLGDVQTSVPFFENKAEAEGYFLAAKKRLGLIGDMLLDIQCLFLAFIYEKTYFRHLQAWFYLQQAASRLQVRLHKSGTRPWASFQSSEADHLHIEQRLFWSCFRAEREFLFEVDLPPSGLAGLSYPDPLPEPPITFSPVRAEPEAQELAPANYDSQLEERGWCYYLAEISLRRTIDDTLCHLFQDGESSWLKNPSQLIHQFNESEKQRNIWRQHLPSIVQFDENVVPDNEFAFGLRGRFLEWHELILRPILYYILHLPCDQAAPPECITLAERAVHLYTQRIDEYQHTLRHGGSWFVTRRIFAYASMILAAVRDPNRRISVPSTWKLAVLTALRTLKFWGRDAPDVRHMTATLDHMYSAVCAEVREPLRMD